MKRRIMVFFIGWAFLMINMGCRIPLNRLEAVDQKLDKKTRRALEAITVNVDPTTSVKTIQSGKMKVISGLDVEMIGIRSGDDYTFHLTFVFTPERFQQTWFLEDTCTLSINGVESEIPTSATLDHAIVERIEKSNRIKVELAVRNFEFEAAGVYGQFYSKNSAKALQLKTFKMKVDGLTRARASAEGIIDKKGNMGIQTWSGGVLDLSTGGVRLEGREKIWAWSRFINLDPHIVTALQRVIELTKSSNTNP